ncbi:hypothetical protein M432DRAFT_600627 [Thermoascus aurantiacus ATCC 26904]
MHRLWSRTAPSQSACRCVSCLNTAANGVASRTATAASRRRLRLGNSVTALYSSIFAAAALADAQAKDKRRLEWEKKIAAVKEEVIELVDEEQRILEALASRRRRQALYQPLQARLYSTYVRDGRPEGPQVEKYRLTDSAQPTKASDDKQLSKASETLGLEPENSLLDYAEKRDEEDCLFSDTDANHSWATGDILRIKAIQKLAIKQLAIRLLLRPVIAHNYAGVPMDYAPDFTLPKLSMPELMAELNAARRRIRALKLSEKEPFDDLAKDLYVREFYELKAERDRFDDALQDDINLYLSRGMSLPELLLRISSNLVSCTEPDRPRAFQLMIMAFTKTRQNDLVDLILRTILPHRFELSTPLIISTLTFFRKSKNLKDFDQFLQMLRGEGYPLNLRTTALYTQKTINGIEVTVPPISSANPALYGTLIAAALRFDQPERAEAWLQAWRATGFMDDFSTLCAFFKFYSVRKDWENGLNALMRAVAFMTSSTSHPEKRIERLIVHMVHFCDSCEQEDVAAALINAAVESGFDWTAAERQWDIDGAFDPAFERWRKAAQGSNNAHKNRTIWEKCHSFASIIGDQIKKLAQVQENGFAQLRQIMVRRYSGDILSTVMAINHQKSGSESSGTLASATSNSPNEEILALKDEVARLKAIVCRFHPAKVEEPRNNAEGFERQSSSVHQAARSMTPENSTLSTANAKTATSLQSPVGPQEHVSQGQGASHSSSEYAAAPGSTKIAASKLQTQEGGQMRVKFRLLRKSNRSEKAPDTEGGAVPSPTDSGANWKVKKQIPLDGPRQGRKTRWPPRYKGPQPAEVITQNSQNQVVENPVDSVQ